MSYEPQKYITPADVFDHLGISEAEQKKLADGNRKKYDSWIKEANSLVNTSLINYTQQIPLIENTEEFYYAQSAALNWVIYKKRDKEGSKNAYNAKADFEMNIKKIVELLKFKPTGRTAPPAMEIVTDFEGQYLLGFSQTQGYPPDLLF